MLCCYPLHRLISCDQIVKRGLICHQGQGPSSSHPKALIYLVRKYLYAIYNVSSIRYLIYVVHAVAVLNLEGSVKLNAMSTSHKLVRYEIAEWVY